MATTTDLAAAVADQDWPRALELALALWRATRAVEVAELIDRIDARLPRIEPPRAKATVTTWWRELALTFDPAALASLVATARLHHGGSARWPEIRERWGSLGHAAIVTLDRHAAMSLFDRFEGANWIERVIALASWPDDPRLVAALVDWFDKPLTIAASIVVAVWELLADRIIALGDTRAIPHITACLAEPRAIREDMREHHAQAARRIVTALDRPRPPFESGIAEAVARCGELVPSTALDTVKADAEIDALWREVVAHPDDTALRLVLADALTHRGDPRGELIVLQCQGPAGADDRAKHLVRKHWTAWMGDLALLASRKHCTFVCGMLESARVGMASSPPWVWRKVIGHRELGTLQILEPETVPPDAYAELAATLPNLIAIDFDAPESILHLAAIDAQLPVSTVNYTEYSAVLPSIRDLPPLLDVCTALARVAPDLVMLDLRYLHGSTQGELDRALPRLPALFGKLQRIRVASYNFNERPAVEMRARGLPLVEIY